MWSKRIQPLGDKRAQSTLEIAVAIICLLILLIGALRLFIWVNQLIVLRQEGYEKSRIQAANASTEQQVNESGFPALNLVGK